MISKGEKICKESMEKLLGKKFEKCRLDFLINPLTGNFLELDCFNQEYLIAVEYNGIQHYHFPNNFHGENLTEFINQIARDKFKNKICQENGIYLIIVPYTIPLDFIPSFLLEKLRERENKILQIKNGTNF